MITSILGGLSGRKVELSEYMQKIGKPEDAKKELDKILDELKITKVNKKLVNLMKDHTSKIKPYHDDTMKSKQDLTAEKYETLFDFVNDENVSRLLSDANGRYQKLEVFLVCLQSAYRN